MFAIGKLDYKGVRSVVLVNPMKQLHYDDLRRLAEILPEVYSHTDLDSFPDFTAGVVQRFVASDLIEYNEIGTGGCVLTQQPTSAEGCRRYATFKVHLNKHPLLGLSPRTGSRCFGGLPGGRIGAELRGSSHEFYRLLGIADQLAFGFLSQVEAWVSIVLNRWKNPFNSRDHLLVEFLQPHLAQAHHNAAALAASQQNSESLSGAFASMHRGLVILNGSEQALWITKSAREWLALYFDEPVREQRLPARLQSWIQNRRAWQKHHMDAGLPEPLTIVRRNSRLIIRFSEDSRGRQFLFLKEEKMGVCPAEFVRLGLTQREGEVLFWICQGKSNPEIATVQGISLRTVHKHVEHILAKLRVETRAGAMLTALQALDESGTISPAD